MPVSAGALASSSSSSITNFGRGSSRPSPSPLQTVARLLLLPTLSSLRHRLRSASGFSVSCSSPVPPPSSSSSFEKLPRQFYPVLCPLLRMEAIYKGNIDTPVSGSSSSRKHFWTRGSDDKNKGLMEQLKQYGVIRSNKVAEVMQTMDRALFVPEGMPPYVDSPMPIGYNATISAPHMHATCLELLKDHLQPGMHALDVGSGTGYLTACFALMVGPEGRAVGVEHIPELVASSMDSIKKSAASSLLKDESLSLHVSDGRHGWPELAPYDAVHVGAAAPDIPESLLEQLKPGGRMVIPVGNFFQDLKVVDKNADGSITVQSETSVRYVPLTSREAQLQDY